MDDPAATRSRFLLARLAKGRPRLFGGLAVALVVYLLTPRDWDGATRILVGWNAGTVLYIVASLVSASRATTKTIRWRASQTDEGRFVILILVSLAAFASIGAIFAELAITKELKGLEKSLHLGLAGLTIVSAWVFIHLSYALHYAHEYFDPAETGDPEAVSKGVAFPGTDEPDYWDFLYFAFIIGVAAQTADVAITARAIRRTSLAHSILSFFFNSAILALTINIAAGLI